MKRVGVAEFKRGLARYLAAVKSGEQVVITERGRPVAHLVAASEGADGWGEVRELERAGLARVGTGRIPDWVWTAHRPADAGALARRHLAEEREAGR